MSVETDGSSVATGIAWADTAINPRATANTVTATIFMVAPFSLDIAAKLRFPGHTTLWQGTADRLTSDDGANDGDATDANAGAHGDASDGANAPLQASNDRLRLG